MQFDETLRYLLSLGHETLALKLGLKNIKLLLESLSNPHRCYQSVQIAGTNGKGSTAVVLNSICRAAGIKSGLYTSPHLVSITERICIGGSDISEREFAYYASDVKAVAEKLVAENHLQALPTFFEHVTAIALLAFREAGVALAILETGLGGRLDATTAAGANIVAITPVALDHEEYLGQTIEEIASEKAGIIREGVTAIVAPQATQALEVILEACRLRDVRPSVNECLTKPEGTTPNGRLIVTFETKDDRYEGVRLGLRGRHQATNVAVAIQLAEALRPSGFAIPRTAIIKGIETAKHPGRLELLEGQPSLLLDGAHNPSGALALRQYLEEFVNARLTLIFGAMSDKKLEEMAGILFSAADGLIVTRPSDPRAASIATLQGVAASVIETRKIFSAGSAKEALQIAKEITPGNGLICVTGSLYLVGEIKAIMNRETTSQAAR